MHPIQAKLTIHRKDQGQLGKKIFEPPHLNQKWYDSETKVMRGYLKSKLPGAPHLAGQNSLVVELHVKVGTKTYCETWNLLSRCFATQCQVSDAASNVIGKGITFGAAISDFFDLDLARLGDPPWSDWAPCPHDLFKAS